MPEYKHVGKNLECINPECGSSDAFQIRESEDGTFVGKCFSCDSKYGNNKLARSVYADEYGIKPVKRSLRNRRKEKAEETEEREQGKTKTTGKKTITNEEKDRIKENSSERGRNFRGINDETLKYFGVRTAFDPVTGKASRRYYPVTMTKNDEVALTAYKERVVESKDFWPKGLVSADCDFFGQWRCKGSGKYILICGGEEDAMAAKQMFERHKKRNRTVDLAPVDVISSCLGEGSCATQAKKQYDFLDGYENIVIDMDNDTAGGKALESLLRVLPLNKVKVMQTTQKDANACLLEGEEKEYVYSFYGAGKPKVAGIVGSDEILDSIKDVLSKPRIQLPPFLDSLNQMLGGGYPMGTFNIIAAFTSVGKSTITNEIMYDLAMFNKTAKPAVLSLEASKGVLGGDLISIHLQKRVSGIEDKGEKISFLAENEAEIMSFLRDGEGDPRFYIIDDRSVISTTDETFDKINQLIRGFDCNVILIDVLSDMTDSMSIEEQAEFMGRIKAMIAVNDVVIIGIMHMRKKPTGPNYNPHDVNEDDIYGSSTAIKSAASVLLLSRDKLADDPLERNTTRGKLTKNRINGITGPIDNIIYDWKTHTCYSETEWLEMEIND